MPDLLGFPAEFDSSSEYSFAQITKAFLLATKGDCFWDPEGSVVLPPRSIPLFSSFFLWLSHSLSRTHMKKKVPSSISSRLEEFLEHLHRPGDLPADFESSSSILALDTARWDRGWWEAVQEEAPDRNRPLCSVRLQEGKAVLSGVISSLEGVIISAALGKSVEQVHTVHSECCLCVLGFLS